MAGDLKPGDVTTLGALRPGDVGEMIGEYGTWSFVTAERRYDGHVEIEIPGSSGSVGANTESCPVRFLGRGRIEPAKIVIEGETDRVAELEEQVRTLREYARECADNFDCDNYAHRYQTFCRQCEARAALAATAPKGEKP